MTCFSKQSFLMGSSDDSLERICQFMAILTPCFLGSVFSFFEEGYFATAPNFEKHLKTSIKSRKQSKKTTNFVRFG